MVPRDLLAPSHLNGHKFPRSLFLKLHQSGVTVNGKKLVPSNVDLVFSGCRNLEKFGLPHTLARKIDKQRRKCFLTMAMLMNSKIGLTVEQNNSLWGTPCFRNKRFSQNVVLRSSRA